MRSPESAVAPGLPVHFARCLVNVYSVLVTFVSRMVKEHSILPAEARDPSSYNLPQDKLQEMYCIYSCVPINRD